MGKIKKILIIEDDKNMHKIYSEMFESHSKEYSISIVEDARIGYKMIVNENIDLIILDIIMEPMDGEVFFATFRSNPSMKKMPVLVISVLSQENLRSHMKIDNNIDFLKKPFTEEKLFEKIQSMIKQ